MIPSLFQNVRNLHDRSRTLPLGDEALRAASYPPPFPDGWYKLADAAEVPRGAVRYLSCLGERLVLFRSDVSDELSVLDAACPHQGANLAGGQIDEGCLECPFHHWRFASNGRVAEIPYAVSRSASLRTRSWPVREYHGQIVMYYSSQRGRLAEFEPPYELEPFPCLLDDTMVYRGAYDHPRPVRMHLIEFAENSVDFQHFAPLHGFMHIPWTPWRMPLMTVSHSPTWETDATHPYICYFHDDAVLAFAGRALPASGAHASITFLGPGGLTVFRISIPKLGDVLLFHTHLPLAPLEQQVQFRWHADRRMPRAIVSYVVGSWIAQWRNDISIWENKYFEARPMLVSGDGPVLKMRRWYKQFYPPSAQERLRDLPAA